MSDSDSLVLFKDQSTCDSKLRIIGGKVKEDSGSPLSSLLLALKIILIYLLTSFAAVVLDGHSSVLTLSPKFMLLNHGKKASLLIGKCRAPKQV